MIISEYYNIDNRLNMLINSVNKIICLEVIDIHDLEFIKLKRTIIVILKKIFDDNNLAEKYIMKFNLIINYYEQKEVNFKSAKESLRQLIYEAIEEVSRVYYRNLKFISNCRLPYLTYLKALKLYKLFNRKLIAKRKYINQN